MNLVQTSQMKIFLWLILEIVVLETKFSALLMRWFEEHFCFGMLEGDDESIGEELGDGSAAQNIVSI